ncbi:MAG: ATP-binding cassette domain-containing protein, partial [Gammaproteobacteria bacterium]|nr:ATP-binding cassette domain-containing protein [Gammaproteobacteria bacterium]
MNTVSENAPLKDQALLSIRSLSKSIDGKEILKNVHFEVPPGRVIGFLGRNGAGKTTTIKAALGFTDYSGDIEVMGQDPKTSRHRVMESVSFISDVGVLPRWLRVDQALEFMTAVHPHFQVEQ